MNDTTVPINVTRPTNITYGSLPTERELLLQILERLRAIETRLPYASWPYHVPYTPYYYNGQTVTLGSTISNAVYGTEPQTIK